ncbi:hypothetical protein NPIL_488761 [Nephila pilipes]|uniref:Uncharacterized protein n=1 Tax=Nephila pilipes TaxID=299642 RepID=A0A8X6U6Z7_NEPPI|nr:hypothetical protein NPIL_488761 [Nephila pilipes]
MIRTCLSLSAALRGGPGLDLSNRTFLSTFAPRDGQGLDLPDRPLLSSASSLLVIFLVPGPNGSDTGIGLFLHLQLPWGRLLTSVFSINEEGSLRFRQFLLTSGLLLL